MLLDVEKFGGVLVLSTSPYEHYDLRIKQANRGTSKRTMTLTEESVCLFGSELKRRKTDAVGNSPGASRRATVWGLVQAENSVSFLDIRKEDSTGGSSCGVLENHFVSVLKRSFQHSILEPFTELVREELLTLDKSVV